MPRYEACVESGLALVAGVSSRNSCQRRPAAGSDCNCAAVTVVATTAAAGSVFCAAAATGETVPSAQATIAAFMPLAIAMFNGSVGAPARRERERARQCKCKRGFRENGLSFERSSAAGAAASDTAQASSCAIGSAASDAIHFARTRGAERRTRACNVGNTARRSTAAEFGATGDNAGPVCPCRHESRQRHLRRRARRRDNLTRPRSLSPHRRGSLKLHGGLHPRLHASSHQNTVKPPVAQLRLICFQRVLARIKRGKPERPILCRNHVHLGAGGRVVQYHRDPRQRNRMQIGKPPRQRARRRRLNLHAMDREGSSSGPFCAHTTPAGAQGKRPNHQPRLPVPHCLGHCQLCRGRSREMQGRKQHYPPAHSRGGSGYSGSAVAASRSLSRQVDFPLSKIDRASRPKKATTTAEPLPWRAKSHPFAALGKPERKLPAILCLASATEK